MKLQIPSFLRVTTFAYAIFVIALTASTNYIYGLLVGQQVHPFFALAAFHLVAFTVLAVSAWYKTGQFSAIIAEANEAYSRYTTKDKIIFWVSGLMYIVSFACLLVLLNPSNAFFTITVSMIGQLLIMVLSMYFLGDKVKNINWFAFGNFILCLAVFLFAYWSHNATTVALSPLEWGLLFTYTVFYSVSDFVKTYLRRKYQVNPEKAMAYPYFFAVLLGFVAYCFLPMHDIIQGGLPNTFQIGLLVYIGVVVIAFGSIQVQYLKDTIGVPLATTLMMPRPIYVLLTQILLYLASPMLLGMGLTADYKAPPSDIRLYICAVLMIAAITIAKYLGKPEEQVSEYK
jgi:hypothetical protein